MVKLGEKVKDKVTNFEGVATARAEYLTGCPRICVEAESPSAEGKVLSAWFDEARLIVT